jgi:hypothetical protein
VTLGLPSFSYFAVSTTCAVAPLPQYPRPVTTASAPFSASLKVS